jgi:hypothetical protein
MCRLIIYFLWIFPGVCYAQTNLFSLPKMELPNLSHKVYAKNEIPSVAISLFAKTQGLSESCPGGPGCLLPLTSLVLKGKRLTKDIVKLDWTTLNEIDVSHFDLQHSFSNSVDFVKIGSLNSVAVPAAEKKYSLPDNNNFEGVTYYRVKSIDVDGRFTFSNIIAVKGIGDQELLEVYPNPAKDNINVLLISVKNATGNLCLYAADGSVMLTNNIKVVKGINNIPINTLTFTAGLYIIKVVRPELPDMFVKFIKN